MWDKVPTKYWNIAAVILLLALAFVFTCFLPIPRESWGMDGPIHAGNISLLNSSIQDGNWLPRWLPQLNGNRGGPNFTYYSFFSYYPASLLCCYGSFSVIEAIQITCRIFFFLGFVGSAFLGWYMFGKGAGFFVPLLFVFSPYPLVLIHSRLALPEYAALSLAPWAFLTLFVWAKNPKPLYSFLLSLQIALFLCLHNLSAIIWIPFLFFAAVMYCDKNIFQRLLSAGGIIASGFLLAFFQFGPSLLEIGWIDASRQLVDIEKFSSWALPLLSLISNSPQEGFSAHLVPGPLIITSIIVACGVLLYQHFHTKKSSEWISRLKFSVLFTLAALALTTIIGAFISRVIPYISYIQFPWRFLGPVSFFGALAGGGLFQKLRISLQAVSWTALVIFIFGISMSQYGQTIHVEYPITTEFEVEHSVYSGDYENKYLPLGARLLPVPASQKLLVPASVTIDSFQEKGNNLSVNLKAASSSWIIVRRYFFQGWRVLLDEKEIQANRDKLNGEIKITIPTGHHLLQVERITRPLHFLYFLVTASAFLGYIITIFSNMRFIAWLPCAGLTFLTLLSGLLFQEGFHPQPSLKQAMEADRIVENKLLSGWSIIHYPGKTVDPNQKHCGYAKELNIGTGGTFREGTGIWAAKLVQHISRQTEIALQYRGKVAVFINGKDLNLNIEKREQKKLDGLKLLLIPHEILKSGEKSQPRIVIMVSGINDFTFARLLVKGPTKTDLWHIIPSKWLQPAEDNLGWKELFRKDMHTQKQRAQ